MALQSAARSTPSGVTVTPFTPAGAGGDTFPTGALRLLVENASGGSTNITITTPATDKYGNAVADIGPVAVADAASKVFGPFPSDLGDVDGNVKVVSSVTTGVKMFLIG